MFCEKAKEFLSQQNVNFTERDVVNDAEALAELEELGIMTTPVIVIDDEVVVGFDRKRLQQLLVD
jgi:glutaredoxin 3